MVEEWPELADSGRSGELNGSVGCERPKPTPFGHSRPGLEWLVVAGFKPFGLNEMWHGRSGSPAGSIHKSG
jgi:hypothetical protein